MLKFNESEFLEGLSSLIDLASPIEELADKLTNEGISNLYLIGAGGTYAAMWPIERFVHRQSSIVVRTAIAAELIVTDDESLGAGSVAVFASVTGTTQDVLDAVDYCRSRGATTIAITGYPDSPLAKAADYSLITAPKAWPFDIPLLLLAGRILWLRNEFPLYERLVNDLSTLPPLLLSVAERAEPVATRFADDHAATDYYFLAGTGNLWGYTYIYSMCILEEMQWLQTTRVHGSEFFHGSMELMVEDTSMLLFMGQDETRPLMERVVGFARTISNDVTVMDTQDYDLPGIDAEVRPLLDPLVLDVVMSRVSKHLERVRNHDLDTRRYYRVMNY